MKNTSAMLIGTIALLLVGSAGYWLGARTTPVTIADTATIHTKPEPKILYYRNPMGLPDISPVPKKDSMGMEYVPVYEGGEQELARPNGSRQIDISIEKVQKLGVKSEVASLRMLDRTVRAVGRIEINERRSYTIAPKFEGWIERLYVNTSGQSVGKSQPLFDVYSPELLSALREYALATQGTVSLENVGGEALAGMRQLAAASLARLKSWDVAENQIKRSDPGEARRTVTFYAPLSGIVMDKKAVQGMRFMPGDMLFQIANLSSVWMIADVSEQDIGMIKAGQTAQINITSYPDKSFTGKVDFIYPTLDTATRTVQVRVELANPQGLLKPAMFANVSFAVSHGDKVLTIPADAVIDSGIRKIVLVRLAQGRFEPREVRLGKRSENHVEVLEGIVAGEQVVTAANFLIDAESNLKAALSGMGGQSDSASGVSATSTEQISHTGH